MDDGKIWEKEMKKLSIKIIGLGGVGSVLCERMARFLNFASDIEAQLVLVDVDIYETKNYERPDDSAEGGLSQ